MTQAQQYADDLYFNRSCGQFVTEDVYFDPLFSLEDLKGAYQAGQQNPHRIIIEQILQLCSSYLDTCRAINSRPDSEDRVNYITQTFDLTAQQYADDLYFNRSCGHFATKDICLKPIFSIVDIEDSYEIGQQNPNEFIVRQILQLCSSYLDICRATNSRPDSEGRINYIIQNL